jgi:quercetin dioxygenase-like cupin family protein
MSANLEAEAPIPDNGILSRAQHDDDRVKVVIFGFSEEQELSAHTAPMAAALYFVHGEARLTLGEKEARHKGWRLHGADPHTSDSGTHSRHHAAHDV